MLLASGSHSQQRCSTTTKGVKIKQWKRGSHACCYCIIALLSSIHLCSGYSFKLTHSANYALTWSTKIVHYRYSYFNTATQQQRSFNGLWSGTTRVGWYQKKHSPTHTHPDHHASFITFLHLQRFMASSLFNLRAWQSSRTTSFAGLLWSSPWSWTLNFMLHTFLHPVIIIFSQHMTVPAHPVLQYSNWLLKT